MFIRDLQAATIVATQVFIGTNPVNIAPSPSPSSDRQQIVAVPLGAAWIGLASNFTASAGIPVASGQPYTERRYASDIYAQTSAATIAINVWTYRG